MTLAKRKEVRQRDVYIRRRAAGPPAPKTAGEALVDEHLREVALDFDLSPILSGDVNFAARVADDFLAAVRSRAESDTDVTEVDVTSRLNTLWPFLYRSLNRFRDRLKTGAKEVVQLKPAAPPKQLPPTARVAEPPAPRPKPRGPGDREPQPQRRVGQTDVPARRTGVAKKIVKRAVGEVPQPPKRKLGSPRP